MNSLEDSALPETGWQYHCAILTRTLHLPRLFPRITLAKSGAHEGTRAAFRLEPGETWKNEIAGSSPRAIQFPEPGQRCNFSREIPAVSRGIAWNRAESRGIAAAYVTRSATTHSVCLMTSFAAVRATAATAWLGFFSEGQWPVEARTGRSGR